MQVDPHQYQSCSCYHNWVQCSCKRERREHASNTADKRLSPGKPAIASDHTCVKGGRKKYWLFIMLIIIIMN